MSNIIPPLISTSPPPLDLTLESDEEDEFRPPYEEDSYSCDESTLPNDLPDIDIPEMDINRNKKEDKDFHDKRKSEENRDYNSDAVLPNIQEIVPNINRHNDDLTNDTKNAVIFDSEDIEIAFVTHKIDDLIPKEIEPITTPFVVESDDNLHITAELDTNIYTSDRDINSPVETVLNSELNDKAISDKELSSSEPNFESCSDNSQKGHENNDGNSNNKAQDKSISDVDEIDDDFGDFADFNKVSSYNFTQISEDEHSEINQTTDYTEMFTHRPENVRFKSECDKDLTKNISMKELSQEELNSSQFIMGIHIDSQIQSQSKTSDFTIENDFISDLSQDSRDNVDIETTITKTASVVSKNEEISARIDEIEMVDSKSHVSTYNAQNPSLTNIKSTAQPEVLLNDSDDEFGEFDSCTVAPTIQEVLVLETTQDTSFPALHLDRNNVHERSKEIIEMMFPEDSQLDNDFLQDASEDNSVFSNIKNLTETNALSYQWSKSNSQQSLLKVLNVDIRNILYGPGWNSSMPIFAANLSSSPLEPQKTSVPTITTSSSNDINVEPSGVCEAQFDWASSGLTNPLDIANQKEVTLKESSLGEPPKSYDTESVNSLHFTEVTTEAMDDKSVPITDLQEFDNFTEFQAIKTVTSEPVAINTTNAMFPLRETYINSNERNIDNLEANETKQSISLNPINEVTLPAVLQTPDCSHSRTDDDFTEFQASLPEITLMDSKQSTNRSIEYKLAIENPIEPELLTSTKQSATILQPTIMQTFKVGNVPTNSAVNIDWPDPGITDDEIRKFEAYSYSKSDKVEKAVVNTDTVKERHVTKSAPKQTSIDDEWSDFQDAAKELPLSIASLGKLAQNHSLTQQRHGNSPANALKQDLWPSTYHQQNNGSIQNNFFPPQAVKQTQPTPFGKGGEHQIKYDQTVLKPISQHVSRHGNSTNDDEWSDFVSHQPSSISSAVNYNHRQEDWTMRGPQFNSWSSTSSSSAMQFNGFNSFGRSAGLLNTSKGTGSIQGKNKGGAPILGSNSKRESVPSISALPDLDFATSASRFSSSRGQQQKK